MDFKTAMGRETSGSHGTAQHFLEIQLKSRPLVGGQFERLIAVVKLAMFKVIGGARLTWPELSDVLLDVETQINRRPLSYMEDDVELLTLTPESFLYQRSTQLPEQEAWRIEDNDLRKRAKFLKTCKDGLWRRWQREYLTALRERHNLTHKTSRHHLKEGDVVIVKSDSKNRGTWPLAIVSNIYPGCDGVVRAVELKTVNGSIQQPVQFLYPLELACDVTSTEAAKQPSHLDPDDSEFRPRRAAAKARIGQILEMEENEI